MTLVLVRKLLRDVRLPLLVVMVLLFGFEMLWAKVTQRITEDLVPQFQKFMSLGDITGLLFQGPGKLVQTIMGGESIRLDRAGDMLSIGLVHPLVITVVGIWAVVYGIWQCVMAFEVRNVSRRLGASGAP